MQYAYVAIETRPSRGGYQARRADDAWGGKEYWVPVSSAGYLADSHAAAKLVAGYYGWAEKLVPGCMGDERYVWVRLIEE
jgi:hypothetical protein